MWGGVWKEAEEYKSKEVETVELVSIPSTRTTDLSSVISEENLQKIIDRDVVYATFKDVSYFTVVDLLPGSESDNNDIDIYFYDNSRLKFYIHRSFSSFENKYRNEIFSGNNTIDAHFPSDETLQEMIAFGWFDLNLLRSLAGHYISHINYLDGKLMYVGSGEDPSDYSVTYTLYDRRQYRTLNLKFDWNSQPDSYTVE